MDSTGCTRCKMHLLAWKLFSNQLDSLNLGNIPIYMIVHPKTVENLSFILRNEKFGYPVCIDLQDSLNKLNHFENDPMFQTFLLDSLNRVVAIGNPVRSQAIERLYFSILKDSLHLEVNNPKGVSKGALLYKSDVIDLGAFPWREQQTKSFKLHNISQRPIHIEELTSSCECLTIESNRLTVRPGDAMTLHFHFSAEALEDDFIREIYIRTDEPHEYLIEVIGSAK